MTDIMEKKLELAITVILDALTTLWKNNGNIMADAVYDNVMVNLSKITGESFETIEKKVESLIEEAQ